MSLEQSHRDPGPTRYVLKHHFSRRGDRREMDLFLEGVIHDSSQWGYINTSMKFASATEASLYAIEHGITDVEVVAV